MCKLCIVDWTGLHHIWSKSSQVDMPAHEQWQQTMSLSQHWYKEEVFQALSYLRFSSHSELQNKCNTMHPVLTEKVFLRQIFCTENCKHMAQYEALLHNCRIYDVILSWNRLATEKQQHHNTDTVRMQVNITLTEKDAQWELLAGMVELCDYARA